LKPILMNRKNYKMNFKILITRQILKFRMREGEWRKKKKKWR